MKFTETFKAGRCRNAPSACGRSRDAGRAIRRAALVAALGLPLGAGMCTPAPVGNGCGWVDPPPDLELCAPGEAVTIDQNLIASCTALTRPAGDWVLGLTEQGREVCGWRF